MSICEHCKHLKTKKLHGVTVSRYCKHELMLDVVVCDWFNRSWKSRLGLITEERK